MLVWVSALVSNQTQVQVCDVMNLVFLSVSLILLFPRTNSLRGKDSRTLEASCTYLQKEHPVRRTSTDPGSDSCDRKTRGPQCRYQRFVGLGCWAPRYLPPLVFRPSNREAQRTRGWNRSASLPGAPPTHGSAGKVEICRMPAGRLVGFHHLRLWLRSPLINPLQS